MKLAAGKDKKLVEFGLRRAQGPDGGISASKYSFVGGFEGTSNVLAGKLFGIQVSGTHAHSFVMSYSRLSEVPDDDFKKLVLSCYKRLGFASSSNYSPSHRNNSNNININSNGSNNTSTKSNSSNNSSSNGNHNHHHFGLSTNEGELAAFIAYAISFPDAFVALLDTYDILSSGVKNFLAVGWALFLTGHKPVGVRVDSGDLAYFSRMIREEFRKADKIIAEETTKEEQEKEKEKEREESAGGKERKEDGEGQGQQQDQQQPKQQSSQTTVSFSFEKLMIVASNDINEDVLLSLNREGHEIDIFGIGTHLVTCQKQPALGCVYKLVEINDTPRIKISQEPEKMVIPGKKEIYRLYGVEGFPLVDLMTLDTEEPPQSNPEYGIKVQHPFVENKRAMIRPVRVVKLLGLVFSDGRPTEELTSAERIMAARRRCESQLSELRSDHTREVNPAPYKVSVSEQLYDYLRKVLWNEMPITELK
jgi:nicotinate phosphoribosyltransferase